ncbi:hypothetical protein AAHA92_27932 [Salvia divinorum]|uniref:Uncharacterized protein n=1 Tax=Salvia divinorum TaxID=28513 RepID=A0ABD1G8F6_SALDI
MFVNTGLKQPSYLKTGTTIMGLIFEMDEGMLSAQRFSMILEAATAFPMSEHLSAEKRKERPVEKLPVAKPHTCHVMSCHREGYLRNRGSAP